MKPTAWNVWLHPRRFARIAAEADETESRMKGILLEKEQLTEDMSELRRKLSHAEEEIARRELKNREINTGALALQTALGIAEKKIAALQEELDERKSVDERISAFELQLNGMEQLKKDYESKLTILQLKLDDALRKLRLSAQASRSQTPSAAKSAKRQPSPETDPTRWLRNLPDNL